MGKVYVVWKGRKTGIFTTWPDCLAQVNGFAGAEYKSFDNMAQAQQAYQGQYEEYKGKKVSSLSAAELEKAGQPISDSYAVDAACAGNPGVLEYRCVHVGT